MLPSIFGENLFDEFFANPFGLVNTAPAEEALYGKHARNLMKTDVREMDNSYELDIDLPGFKKDEIHLELNNGYLTISTEKSLEKTNENKKGKMLRQERYSGVMQRSFFVGEHMTEEDIKASYESGVLHIIVPKKDAPRVPERKTILIEG